MPDTKRGRVGAVVLAAGLSSRMGRTKALLPFGESRQVIDRVIGSLQEAGADPVVVVTGHDRETVTAAAERRGAVCAYNAEYARGMFGSVITGIRALRKCGVDGFFLLPVDYPLVNAETMRALRAAFAQSVAPIVYPTYCGKKGHPPLISASLMDEILAHDGAMGLKGALMAHEKVACYFEVDDPAILQDMDTPLDYFRLSRIDAGTYAYRHLFLQGDIWAGKSALLEEKLRGWEGSLGGFRVIRQYRGGRCNRFALESVQENLLPKRLKTPLAERVFMEREGSVWRFIPQVFENYAAPLLRREMEAGLNLFLLDEIGGMELQNVGFTDTLSALFRDKCCVGVFKSGQGSAAQQDAMDTGENYTRMRGKYLQEIIQNGGRLVTLHMDNKYAAAAALDEYLARLAGREEDRTAFSSK